MSEWARSERADGAGDSERVFPRALMASAGRRGAHAGLGHAVHGALALARLALALRQSRALARPLPHRPHPGDGLTAPRTHPGGEQLRTEAPGRVHRAPAPPPTPLEASAPVSPPPTSRPPDRPSPPPRPPLSALVTPPDPSTEPLEAPSPAQLRQDLVDTLETPPAPNDAPSLPSSSAQLDPPASEIVVVDAQEAYTEPRLAVRRTVFAAGPVVNPDPLVRTQQADATASKVPSSRLGRLMHYGGESARFGSLSASADNVVVKHKASLRHSAWAWRAKRFVARRAAQADLPSRCS